MTDVTLPTPTPGALGEHVFHTAAKTFIDEAGANGEKVARKLQVSDRGLWVSPNGSDSNDGLSGGSAKLTPQAAIDALPDGGFQAVGGQVNILGTVEVDAPVTNTKNSVQLVGQGAESSILKASASFAGGDALVDFTNSNLGVHGCEIAHLAIDPNLEADHGIKICSPSSGGENTPNYVRYTRHRNIRGYGIIVGTSGGFGTHVLFNRIQVADGLGELAESGGIKMLDPDNMVIGNRIAGGYQEAGFYIAAGGNQLSLNHTVANVDAAGPVAVLVVAGSFHPIVNNYFDFHRDGPTILIRPASLAMAGILIANNATLNNPTTDNAIPWLELDATNAAISFVNVTGNLLRCNVSNRFSHLLKRHTSATSVSVTNNMCQRVVSLWDNRPDGAVAGNNIFSTAQTLFSSRSSITSVQTGDGVATQFSFTHLMERAPRSVVVVPASSGARGDFHVTDDATNIYVNYATAPANGASLQWNWFAEV